jgi:hypothetical protein
MSNQMMVTVAASRGRYPTRTTGEAHLYRVIQYYDCWPFEPDSRVPAGSTSRQRTETFRTLEPVRQRLTRASLYARHRRRNGGDWSAFVAIAEQLTDDGWQPLDLDVLPPRPAGSRRGRSARTWPSGHGAAPAVAGRTPAGPARPPAGKDTPR